MACVFSDNIVTDLITIELLKHYSSTLSAWCNRPLSPTGLGFGAFGDVATLIEAVSFIKKHGFRAALPTALYDICHRFSAVSGL